MTYSLNTLNNPCRRCRRPPGGGRFAHEIALVLGLPRCCSGCWRWLSHSAAGRCLVHLRRRRRAQLGGRLGAWLADLSYFSLGFRSGGALPPAVRAWMATLARWMRGAARKPGSPARRAPHPHRLLAGLVVLLLASTALEWSRLYRFEPRLPGMPAARSAF